ncbi:MAG: (Fe-S)-binding protein [Deltaproteobacteria bacterium]|nr:(Fe-S)-binding protein [Deltaproteobacteria bacterium]
MVYNKADKQPGYEACTGCCVCTLPCPVWHQTHDNSLTVHGRARALQGGNTCSDLKESIMACVLCGACEPACPFGIKTVDMTIELRAQLADQNDLPLADQKAAQEIPTPAPDTMTDALHSHIFLPGRVLRADKVLLDKTFQLLNTEGRVSIPSDDGSGLIEMLEAGIQPSPEQKEQFIRPLRKARKLTVTQGLLHRYLRRWLPGTSVTGLGESLLAIKTIQTCIRPADLYIIETRGFHSDFKRLVSVYHRLRGKTGCHMNLDLQRIAIPTGAACLQDQLNMNHIDTAKQVRWIIEGRRIDRIIVESPEDIKPFQDTTKIPVIHISELG